MRVRLSDVLAPHCGLVKDKFASVIRVVLHETDQAKFGNRTSGYCRFTPSRMARGIWLRLLNTTGLPLSSDIPAADEGIDNAVTGSMMFLDLVGAEFKPHMHIHGEQLPVQVVRW